MFSYDTITEALAGLKQRGYTTDFNLSFDRIVCHQTPVTLMPADFEITELYRFEGETDPADEAIIYAIESKQGLKGTLVNAYGLYADESSAEMVKKLSTHPKHL
jgi:hypothetical protein